MPYQCLVVAGRGLTRCRALHLHASEKRVAWCLSAVFDSCNSVPTSCAASPQVAAARRCLRRVGCCCCVMTSCQGARLPLMTSKSSVAATCPTESAVVPVHAHLLSTLPHHLMTSKVPLPYLCLWQRCNCQRAALVVSSSICPVC